jgi:flagellar assembly protein FliH
MSDSAPPKEQLTAYERWELPSFGTTGVGNTGQSGAHARQQGNKAGIVLPTAVQLEEIQRQAHDEGYQAGYAEGTQRIAALLNAMEQALQQADQAIAQDLLSLSLEVARQMVQQTLKIKPEVLLSVISEAISSLPHFNQGAHLVLHPDDAAMVRASMGEQLSHSGWKIYEDALLARGGARVETAHSQIDATLANRWQRIVAAIGQDSSWIQE